MSYPGANIESKAITVHEPTVPVVRSEAVSVEGLIAKALEHGISVEGLERLLTMRERLQAESARNAYHLAMVAFQSECPIIPKKKTANITTSSGGSYQYRFAPLEDIVAAVQPILRRHGLSYSFDVRFEDEPMAQVVICTVNHVDGHAESSQFRTPIDRGARMSEAQKSASAQTYAKRYAFCNALGILTGDEDVDGSREPQRETRSAGQTDSKPPTSATSAAPTSPRPIARGNVKVLKREADPDVDDPEASARKRNETARLVAKRREAIEQQMILTRTIRRYAELSEEDCWDKSVDLLNASVGIHFNSLSLTDLHESDLDRVLQMLAEAIDRKYAEAQ